MTEQKTSKEKKAKISSNLDNAKWFLGVGLFLCIISPIIFTQPYFYEFFNYSNTGQIGDTIGGITSPIVNILGSILVFFALRAQIDANNLIQEQFDDQKNEENNRKKLMYITEQVNIIRGDIREFTFTYMERNYKYNYSGSDAIYQFLKSIRNGEHELSYEEFAMKNPKINELVNLFKIFHKQIELIKREDISDFDKTYFISILEYQYNSKIKQPIHSYKKHKRSKQHVCVSCNEKHGIPDEIFDECEKIEMSFNNKLSKTGFLSKEIL